MPTRARRHRLQLGLVAAGLSLTSLDTYAVVTLLPQMMTAVDLPIDRVETAAPILSGFLGGYVAAMPLLGAYSDSRGRAIACLGALAAFALGSALTAAAPWLGALVAGRTLQGLGGGALVPLAMALAADLYPIGRRAPAIGLLSALQEAGSVLGPVWGAVLALWLGGWRGVFWLNLPLSVGIGLGLWVEGRGELPIRSGRRQLDWLGALLLGGGLGLLVLALYPNDPQRGALNGAAALLLVLAAGTLATFVWWQRRRLEPLLGPHLLHSRVFWASMLANLLAGAGLMVALVDLPLLGRGVYGLGSVSAALLLSRLLLGIPLGALAGGWLAQRLDRGLLAAGGLGLAATVFWLLSRWSVDELQAAGAAATLELLAGGFAFGLVIAPLASAVLDLSSAAEHGLVSSLVVLARVLGMVVGLTALTAFGLARFQAIFAQLRCGVAIGEDLGRQLAVVEACARTALLQEYREIFTAAALICLVGAACALLGVGGTIHPAESGPEPG